jgi:2-polyprenyl-6-methoxyphenol hydroxylase-like FAD-dependent oxidoreductase
MIDVLIVGAGPVGLTLAIDLLRRGITCRIIERSPAFAVGTRARGISARTQELFESMGLLSALRQCAEPNLPARFYDRDNRLVRETPASKPVPPSPDIPFPNALMVSQENTDAVLRRRLDELGGTVETDCALVAFTQDSAGVVASLIHSGNNETISALYLVGCDGGGSTVRKCVGIQFMGETWEDAANYLIANLSVTGLDGTHWHVWTDREWGYVTLQPVIHSHAWLFVATIHAHDVAESAEPTAQSLQRLFEGRLPLPKVTFQDVTWHSLYRRNLRIVDRYRSGRVFLAGDSAHVGVEHGMNIGIQDAYNLSWKIAQVLQGAPDRLLDTYEQERQPIAQRILDVTLNRDRNDAGGAAAARSIEGAVSGEESANDPTQLSVNYGPSSLSCDFDRVTAIRAGDRAPDSPGLLPITGQRVRLFEILDPKKFTLLCFSDLPISDFAAVEKVLTVYRITRPGAPSGEDGRTIADTEGHAHRIYGIDTDALVLIRPDGYVAATGTHCPDHKSAMLRHLLSATPCGHFNRTQISRE